MGFENPSHDEVNVVDDTSLKSVDDGKISPLPSPRVAEIITRNPIEESGLHITSEESAEGYSFR